MYVSEQGEGHFKDRLYVYWDVTTRCNYKCSYCYARRRYVEQGRWGLTDEWLRQRLVLAAIKLSTLPVYLGFHGGEPSLHPRYKELVNLALEALCRPDDCLYIATNATKGILETPDGPIRILASFHPEFSDAPEFIRTIKALMARFQTVKVNVLLHTGRQYWPSLHKVYNECSKLGLKVHPHFIYDRIDGIDTLWHYSDGFYDEFRYMMGSKCWYEFRGSDGTTQRVSDLELFEHKLNGFKGWSCYNNNYEIFVDSLLHQLCTTEYTDLPSNIMALRRIKEIKPMLCPFERCSSDGVLKCLKISPQSRAPTSA